MRLQNLNSYLFLLATIMMVLPAANFATIPEKIRTLLSSLDPKSASEHLAFYELYPDTQEGAIALTRAWNLLSGTSSGAVRLENIPSEKAVRAIIALVNKQSSEKLPTIQHQDLTVIESLAQKLENRKLKGYRATSEEQILKLPPEEIDLARGLLLSQKGEDALTPHSIRCYEAMIDLMALQILARLDPDVDDEKVIHVMNQFIFDELAFRFPPHSLYAKDVDLYTFLPSVLDSRRGVCLGVSILYLAISQRLGIPLEIITPPGHIYVRYRKGNRVINIETTARGVNTDSEIYMGMNTRKLQKRDIKETIGFAHVNKASIFLTTNQFEKAKACYEIATRYIPNDTLVQQLYGITQIITGDQEKGYALLQEVVDILPDDTVSNDTLVQEILNNDTNIEGIKAIFHQVDENRASVERKKAELAEIVQKYPRFCTGLFYLGITELQLHREGEALETLTTYHEMNPSNPTVEYILCVLAAKRMDYLRAWEHFRQAEKIVTARNHYPKTLTELKKQLAVIYPE